MKKLIALAIAATFASAAYAAPETYNLEPNHTLPRFEYNHLGYSMQLSRFDKTSGKIVLDRVAHTGSADIVIDTTSVNTGSTLFNGHIQGEGLLETDKFPTITFKSHDFKFDGDKLVAVNGDLTIKDVTKAVTLTVNSFKCMPHPMLKKDACGATASTVIKRTEFHAGKYAPYVSDEVTLTLPVEAIKE